LPWKQSLPHMMHHPVGVSLWNGQGVSGVLCGTDGQNIYLMEYLYQTQFATKHYPIDQIQDITPFPNCHVPDHGPLY
jgi:hypothetical protein